MAVYYKFKSAKDFDTIPIDGHFISVANLKERIFESKHLGRGTDFDLMVANAQTNEEYPDEASLIPKNTSVLVRRVPGRPRMPIVSEREEPKVEDNKAEDVQSTKGSSHMADSSSKKFAEETEWDEFGNDLYAIPEVVPVQFSHPVQDAPPPNKADEDSKIKALIDMPAFGALDWQQQPQEGFGSGRGFGRGMGGRMIGGRGFGRGGMERKTPPPGYTCHRCKVPGHFIQHCPTNGDPNYDIKRFKPPTGIPKSMLMATPDGSYGLPSGAVAILKPNEAAFEKEIEGLPSTRPVTDLPPELHCPLCKEVMKDAVLTSKCCFNSFCDKCIRDHIISKSMCICGATNILADDLLPNKALRDTINRILESNNSSAENGGSTFQVQDMESARCAQPKVPSPTLSATSKGGQMAPPCKDETLDIKEAVNEGRLVSNPPELLEKVRTAKTAERSEATLESMSVKEPMSQGSAPQAEEEVQQKLPPVEPGKKKKKMKTRLPVNAADLQWRTSQDLTSENHMIPFGPSAYNSYWGGMPLGMDGYMAPYTNAMPYMGYAPGPFDVPFGGYLPQDPFGGQGYLPVVPPQRDLSEFGIGSNPKPPVMSREEFEARKADVRKKRENELRRERECSKDREFGGEGSGTGDVSSTKSKHRPFSLPTSGDHHHHHHHRRAEYASSPERPSREFDHVRLGKRRLDHHDDLAVETAKAAADKKLKASVFSRISFPEGVGSKKRKSSSETNNASNGYKDYDPPVSSTQHRPLSNGYRDERKPPIKGTAVTASSGGAQKGVTVHYDSSDDERHFKRRPSRYEPPPPPPVEWDEDTRPLRSSREHEQERSRHRT